jgi:hypothetical protein
MEKPKFLVRMRFKRFSLEASGQTVTVPCLGYAYFAVAVSEKLAH